jgi:hypothetical protein
MFKIDSKIVNEIENSNLKNESEFIMMTINALRTSTSRRSLFQNDKTIRANEMFMIACELKNRISSIEDNLDNKIALSLNFNLATHEANLNNKNELFSCSWSFKAFSSKTNETKLFELYANMISKCHTNQRIMLKFTSNNIDLIESKSEENRNLIRNQIEKTFFNNNFTPIFNSSDKSSKSVSIYKDLNSNFIILDQNLNFIYW